MNKYFDDLLDVIDLKMDDKEREDIREKHKALRVALRQKLPLVDDFLTGSYKRHTIIKPKKSDEKFDVDVFVCFDREEYGDKALKELREAVFGALTKIMEEQPELGITAVKDSQRRSVCVEYGSRFQIDVVPALEIEKDKMYRIFDKKTLESVDSNPKYHAALLSEANEAYDERLVPIIKILKSWKRIHCSEILKSYHLELLAYSIFLDKKFSSYSESTAEFFAEVGSDLEEACMKDPANEEHLIDEYLDKDKTRNELLELISEMNIIAKNALALEEKGEDASGEWDKLFCEREDNKTIQPRVPVSVSISPPKPHGYE